MQRMLCMKEHHRWRYESNRYFQGTNQTWASCSICGDQPWKLGITGTNDRIEIQRSIKFHFSNNSKADLVFTPIWKLKYIIFQRNKNDYHES